MSETQMTAEQLTAEQLQEAHYDRIFETYNAHYGDTYSEAYRRKFIYSRMFGGIPLTGAQTLEGMSGSGQTTGYLLEHGAHVTGLDISPKSIELFKQKWPGAKGVAASILDSGLPENSFDCVNVFGGLHHIHPHVKAGVREIHRILKPGGYFSFCEPSKGGLPDIVRNFWYKRDPLFEDNEAAIDVQRLKQDFASQFEFLKEDYLGNIAYLLVLNSMVFRIPLKLKSFYSPILLPIESVLTHLQTKSTSCFVVCQWRKL